MVQLALVLDETYCKHVLNLGVKIVALYLKNVEMTRIELNYFMWAYLSNTILLPPFRMIKHLLRWILSIRIRRHGLYKFEFIPMDSMSLNSLRWIL